MYCGFSLDEPKDDIASDVLSTLTLVGEFSQASQLLFEVKPKTNVHVVEEATGLDGIENVPMFLQIYLKDLECINTHDLSLTQLQSDLEENPIKCFTFPVSLSPNGHNVHNALYKLKPFHSITFGFE